MSDTYFEVRTADGPRERLEVANVASAKAAAKAVSTVTGEDVELYKVTEIDINAPARTRSTG